MPTHDHDHDEMSDRIFRTLRSRRYEPSRMNELARLMRIAQDEMGDFHAACKALMKTGRIVLGGGDSVTLPPPAGMVTGTYRSNPRGFGFVIPDDPNVHGDLFVRGNDTGGAMTGDTVKASVSKRGKRDGTMKYEGRIVEILKRGQNRFVGELHHRGSRWFVVPNGNTLHQPIMVGDPGAKGAKENDHVVVEITRYPTDQSDARGVIVKVLGQSGEPGVDTKGIIEQYGFNEEFDDDVLNNARAVSQAYDPDQVVDQREDLRKETIITIDPVDARDFDDAISLKTLDNQRVELGVHIADVSHFVREDSPLDKEAYQRATSVYLPRKVIPMLPEILSNGVCSLQENENRLTKSVFITYDDRADICGVRYANTIIRSTKRLTYEQATDILAGKPDRVDVTIVNIIKQMGKLARLLQLRRIREGMLELDLPEIDLVFDDKGTITGVTPTDTSYSHKVIEMFMVEANEAVARLFVKLSVPHMRRIHDDPDGLTSGTLQKFIRAIGQDLPDEADRFDLQQLLARVRGLDESYTVQIAILRSMSVAEYSPRLVGHYALASKDYCHFTSPIRRYPDLMIHRLLDRYIAGEFKTKAGTKNVPDVDELLDSGAHCSLQSRQAEAAERELKQLLILRLLENRVGDVFDGIVTGVVNMGVFVQLKDYLIDGLIRFEHMSEDWWEVDESGSSVVGTSTGQRITVGDRVKVHIRAIHIPMRQMELGLDEPAKHKNRKLRAGDGGSGAGKTGRGKLRAGDGGSKFHAGDRGKEKATRGRTSGGRGKADRGKTAGGSKTGGDRKVAGDGTTTGDRKAASGGKTTGDSKTTSGRKKGHRGQKPGSSRSKGHGKTSGGKAGGRKTTSTTASGGNTSGGKKTSDGKTVGGKTSGAKTSGGKVRDAKSGSGKTGGGKVRDARSGSGTTGGGSGAKTGGGKSSGTTTGGGKVRDARSGGGKTGGGVKASGGENTSGRKTGSGKATGGKFNSSKTTSGTKTRDGKSGDGKKSDGKTGSGKAAGRKKSASHPKNNTTTKAKSKTTRNRTKKRPGGAAKRRR